MRQGPKFRLKDVVVFGLYLDASGADHLPEGLAPQRHVRHETAHLLQPPQESGVEGFARGGLSGESEFVGGGEESEEEGAPACCAPLSTVQENHFRVPRTRRTKVEDLIPPQPNSGISYRPSAFRTVAPSRLPGLG